MPGSGGGHGTFLVIVGVVAAVAAFSVAFFSGEFSRLGAALIAAAAAPVPFAVEKFSTGRKGATILLVVSMGLGVTAVIFERSSAKGALVATPSAPSSPNLPNSTDNSTGSLATGPSASPAASSNVPSSHPASTPAATRRVQQNPAPLPVPAQIDPGQIRWDPTAKRLSHAPPTIKVFLRGWQPDGTQEVQFAADGLSVGAIEFDVNGPSGGTFFGMSFANYSTRRTWTYRLRPFEGGLFTAIVHDKETDDSASVTFQLDQGPGDGESVQNLSEFQDPSLESIFSKGKACDLLGANVVVAHSGVPSSATLRIDFPGSYLTSGISSDSLGGGENGFIFRADNCTGSEISGFTASIVDAGGSVVLSRDFTVSN